MPTNLLKTRNFMCWTPPHRQRTAARPFAVFFAANLLFATAALGQNAGPKLLSDTKAGDCATCHGGSSPLPKDHLSPAALAWTDCVSCHVKGESTSLVGKLSLSHVHLLSGVGCSKCHSDPKKPEPAAAKTCTACHEPAKVAAATAEVKPNNPHDSPHYGQNSDCNLCHHEHKKSTNDCAQCHSFPFHAP